MRADRDDDGLHTEAARGRPFRVALSSRRASGTGPKRSDSPRSGGLVRGGAPGLSWPGRQGRKTRKFGPRRN